MFDETTIRERSKTLCEWREVQTLEELRARQFVSRRNVFDGDFMDMLDKWAVIVGKQGLDSERFMQSLVDMYNVLGDIESQMYVIREIKNKFGESESLGGFRL